MIKGIEITGVKYCIYKYNGFKYHAAIRGDHLYMCGCFGGFKLERKTFYPFIRKGRKRKERPYSQFFRRRIYGRCSELLRVV